MLIFDSNNILRAFVISLGLLIAKPAISEDVMIAKINEWARLIKDLPPPSAEMETALRNLRKQLDETIPVTVADNKTALEAAMTILSRSLGVRDYDDEAETLRDSVQTFQQDIPIDLIDKLAKSLTDTLPLYANPEYPEGTRKKLIDLLKLLEPIESARPRAALTRRATGLINLIDKTDSVASGDVVVGKLANLRVKLIEIEESRYIAALRQRIDDLKAVLEKEEGIETPSLRTEDHEELRAVITLLEMQLPPAPPPAVDPATQVVALAQALTEALGEYPGSFDEEGIKVVLAALEALEDREATSAIKALHRRAGRLQALITATGPVNDGSIVVQALLELGQELIKVEAHQYPVALATRISNLETLLALTPPARPSLTAALRTRILGLRGTIDKVVPEATSGIHVISARYGRVSGPGSSGDTCDATPAMRLTCQGNTTCQLPMTGASGSEVVNLGAFCGGTDPAPLARSRHKGLGIRYVCLSGTEDDWRNYLNMTAANYRGPSISAVLRSAADEISCTK